MIKRIILVRHGESEANVDHTLYNTQADHTITLTQKGINQALDAGIKLSKIIKDETTCFYVSPYERTKETYKQITKSFHSDKYITRYDPRLVEQQWKSRCDVTTDLSMIDKALNFGEFYYRPLSGESCSDMYGGRVATFCLDFKRFLEDSKGAENVVIITHCIWIRVFLMRWFWLDVEDFNNMPIPDNATPLVIDINSGGNYQIKNNIYNYTEKTLKEKSIKEKSVNACV